MSCCLNRTKWMDILGKSVMRDAVDLLPVLTDALCLAIQLTAWLCSGSTRGKGFPNVLALYIGLHVIKCP
jgi:hypothetical protein